MRIDKKEDTVIKEKDNIIKIQDSLRIPRTDIILESGDKIEILEKEKLKESHLQPIYNAFVDLLIEAYEEDSLEYAIGEIEELFEFAVSSTKRSYSGLSESLSDILSEVKFERKRWV